jgi:hypothetical protein
MWLIFFKKKKKKKKKRKEKEFYVHAPSLTNPLFSVAGPAQRYGHQPWIPRRASRRHPRLVHGHGYQPWHGPCQGARAHGELIKHQSSGWFLFFWGVFSHSFDLFFLFFYIQRWKAEDNPTPNLSLDESITSWSAEEMFATSKKGTTYHENLCGGFFAGGSFFVLINNFAATRFRSISRGLNTRCVHFPSVFSEPWQYVLTLATGPAQARHRAGERNS